MSWFTNNEKVHVQRTLGRILNRTLAVSSHFEIDHEHDQRLESRSPRVTPVLVLPLTSNDEESLVRIGLTQDISCQGLSLATLGKLAVGGEYAVGMGNREDFAVLKFCCVRTESMGYGYFASGLFATQVLSVADFVALRELAEHLESNIPVSELNFLAI